ncbi:glycoside hydrolase family 65 protein [Antrihabitans spumae]|uniref:Glycoside hydrolase family 65 protein n=1 Tax=Antrihabitans spumae TaxID=3373370 RepID=A0ABW7JQZ2_9NOCA
MLRSTLSTDEWLLTESGFDIAKANYYETVFTVGNGLLGTRGSLEEGHLGELSGTYLNGVFDSHDSPVIDLVNAPDWLSVAVSVDGVRLDVQSCTVVSHHRALDTRHGILWRETVFEDDEGRRTRLETLRFASMADRRLCGLRVQITPENHTSEVTVDSAIDGRRRNLERLPVYPEGTTFEPEIRWEKWARTKHLVEVGAASELDAIYLEMRTVDSGIHIGYAATTQASKTATRQSTDRSFERISRTGTYDVGLGESLRIDKLVTIATSRDIDADSTPLRDSCFDALWARRAEGFDACVVASSQVWDRRWTDSDCEIIGDADATQAMRFNIYHLLIAANGDDNTVSIGAKSLSGEGYRGHVFWDTEILMMPFFTYTQPETARALLHYRHHTLDGARELSRSNGTRGARYAWESADTGREECPQWTQDGANRFWTREEELHVSADVAYAITTYVAATNDTALLLEFGAEIVFETARFWADRVEPAGERYVLKTVIGPDEFHSHVDNNAFTNRMVKWHLGQANTIWSWLKTEHPDRFAEITEAIALTPTEVARWHDISEWIVDAVVSPDGIIEQFDGYFERDEIPIAEWDRNDMPRYPAGYNHFNCETTKLLKQPDVVMLMYLLPDEFDAEAKRSNFEYYESRTLHKSSLSPAIHAIMGIEVGDFTRALKYFTRSAFVDLHDNQGNTHEGMHAASTGGTWQTLVCGFGGFRVLNGHMSFTPWLPEHWEEIRFRLQWRGSTVRVAVRHNEIELGLDAASGTTEPIMVCGREYTLSSQRDSVIAYSRAEVGIAI